VSSCRWTTLDELKRRCDEWRQLLAASEFPSGFADPGWVLGWWSAYADRREPWCLVAERGDGSLVGLTVLALSSLPFARMLTFAASSWNGLETLVCAPGSEAEFTSMLLTELAARRREWDVWRLRRVPRTTALAHALLSGREPLHATASDVRLQPFIELPPSVEDFDARFASKARNTQRRKAKRLRELGARARLVSEPAEAERAVHELLELRMQRAAEQAQQHAHMDERFERFLVAAVRKMLPSAARLWTMELDGRTLAMRLNLVAGPREHSYLLGLSDEHRNLSPGSTLERFAIDHAIGEGRGELDLGPGREEYKYRWGASDREVTRIVVPSGSPRAWLSGTAAALDVRMRASAAAEALRRRRGIAPST
jgi:CelD/BcsL family acetyltransferase involved in cellulose biosynthesis